MTLAGRLTSVILRITPRHNELVPETERKEYVRSKSRRADSEVPDWIPGQAWNDESSLSPLPPRPERSDPGND